MVLLHPQHIQQQQQKQSRPSAPVGNTSSSSPNQHPASSTATVIARRPSPTDALKHLRPAIPSPNTVLASLLANPDAAQLDFLSLFDPPATLPSDVLSLASTKTKDDFMDDYYGCPTQSQQAFSGYPPRRQGLPSVSPPGAPPTGVVGAPLAPSRAPAPNYPPSNPYSAAAAAGYGHQYAATPTNAHPSVVAARLQHFQQQQQYFGAFRTRGGSAGSGGGVPTLPLPNFGHGYQVYGGAAHLPRSGINGYDTAAQDEEDTGDYMSAAHFAHARALSTTAANTRANPLGDDNMAPQGSGAGVVDPLALETTTTTQQQAAGTALALTHDSTPNLAVRLRYAADGRSLLRADHADHPCHDPMVLGGRLVDMSVHMEHYLQDLLPRKGEDHSDWQPVDITFDILSSRLRQTLDQMERFRGEMTRKASAERHAKQAKALAAAAAASGSKSATKRLQASRAVKPVTADAGSNSGRARVTEPVRS